MTTIITTSFVAAAVLLLYIFILRPIMVKSVLLSPAFKAEASYTDQLRAKLVGWKTKLAARFFIIAGFLVEAYNNLAPLVGGQDWTPLTQNMPAWVVPVGLVGISWLFSYLRKVTENPPQVVMAKDDDGSLHVVDLIKPTAPTAS